MKRLIHIKADWEGLKEHSEQIETLLNDMILNQELTVAEIKNMASLCLDAVNNYTNMANKNIQLLYEQTREMLYKVQNVLNEEGEEGNLEKDPDFHIH